MYSRSRPGMGRRPGTRCVSKSVVLWSDLYSEWCAVCVMESCLREERLTANEPERHVCCTVAKQPLTTCTSYVLCGCCKQVSQW